MTILNCSNYLFLAQIKTLQKEGVPLYCYVTVFNIVISLNISNMEKTYCDRKKIHKNKIPLTNIICPILYFVVFF